MDTDLDTIAIAALNWPDGPCRAHPVAFALAGAKATNARC